MCDKKGWENEEFRWGMGAGILISVILALVIGGQAIDYAMKCQRIRTYKEAIENGVGYYEVDSEGKTTFKWKK